MIIEYEIEYRITLQAGWIILLSGFTQLEQDNSPSFCFNNKMSSVQ